MRSVLLVGVLLASATLAREAPAEEERPPVLAVRAAALTTMPGDTTLLRLELTIAEGHHVQANPAGGPFLVPLEAVIEPAAGVTLGEVHYPPPQVHRLVGSDMDLPTYRDVIELDVPVAVLADAKPGVRELQVQLRYQACTASVCLMPAVISTRITVSIGNPTPAHGTDDP